MLLSCIFWSDWNSFHTVDDAWQHFYDIINAVIKDSIPTFKLNGRAYPQWYSKELISLVREKEKSRRAFLKCGRDVTSSIYKTFCCLRRKIKQMQKRCHAEHICKLEREINTHVKRFWSHVKSKSVPVLCRLI